MTTQVNHLTSIPLEYPTRWKDYILLDSGNGFKLEQYGPYRLVRPEAEAVWSPALPDAEWKKANATYKPSPEENGGHWEFRGNTSTMADDLSQSEIYRPVFRLTPCWGFPRASLPMGLGRSGHPVFIRKT